MLYLYLYLIQVQVGMMDTKFSVALHILVMLSESGEEQTSATLAHSVGTNPSYIRKIMTLLKRAHLISAHQGRGGYELTKPASDITLQEIYYATQETESVHLFAIHSHPNKECPVGSHIQDGVSPIFSHLEQQFDELLKEQTLHDVIENMYRAKEQTK